MTKTPKKPEQPAQPTVEADIEERTKKFNEELGPLLGKYELGIGAMAEVTQDGRLAGRVILVSARNRNTQPAAAETALVEG